MREFGIPALAQIPATANLADVVFRRAAEQPEAVVLRRPSGPAGVSGEWTDVTASQFSGEVIARERLDCLASALRAWRREVDEGESNRSETAADLRLLKVLRGMGIID